MLHLILVIVGDLDIVGIAIDETGADAPLVVDRDGVLSLLAPPKLAEPGGTLRSPRCGAKSMYSSFCLARRTMSGGNRFDLPAAYS